MVDGVRAHNHHALVAHGNVFYKEINNINNNNTKIRLII